MRVLILSLVLLAQTCLAQFGVEQPFFAMQSISGPEPPSGFLKLWLKPESLAGMTNDQRIVTWTDSSPYLNHGTNGTAGGGPIVATNAFGTYSAAKFFAGGGYILVFKTNYGLSMLRNVPGSTLYEIITPHGYAGMYPFNVKDSGGSKLRLGPNGSGYSWRFIGKATDADADQIGNWGTGPSDTNKFFLLNFVVSYTGRSWSLFTNGVQCITQTGMGWTAANTSDTDTSNTTPPAIGDLNYTGKVLELLLYATNHAPSDRALVETYLTNKYGSFSAW